MMARIESRVIQSRTEDKFLLLRDIQSALVVCVKGGVRAARWLYLCESVCVRGKAVMQSEGRQEECGA